jgi:hypothetical protein
MLSSRIVAAGAAVAIAITLTLSGASAQIVTDSQIGKPLSLLAGMRPPAQKLAAKKSATRTRRKIASQQHDKVAVTQSEDNMAPRDMPSQNTPSQEPSASAQPVFSNVWPGTEGTVQAEGTPAAPVESAPSSDALAKNALVVDGETVQIASPDQVNAIDLAANDNGAAKAPAVNADAGPRAHVAFAAPARKTASGVGSASWIAQVLAALGGAVAAGSIAWFLIGGSGPQRMYG